MEQSKLALLIDSDNISAKYISGILDELTKYGITTYRRIYGDWTSPQATKWKEELLKYSISPIQQFSNTSGKNATDIALIIDAMDILYTGKVDGYCIVSSDGDFTKLASRLRESNMEVIGMGEHKTPRSFVAACTKFTWLENLLVGEDEIETDRESDREVGTEGESNHQISKGTVSKAEDKKSSNEKKLNMIDQSVIEETIMDIILENENKNRTTGLGEVGSRLVNKYPDFDSRNYGYSVLSKFLESLSKLKLVKTGSSFYVKLNDGKVTEESIRTFVVDTLKASGEHGMTVNELSNKVHVRFAGFKVKDYGYSQFTKFLQSISGTQLSNSNKDVRLKG